MAGANWFEYSSAMAGASWVKRVNNKMDEALKKEKEDWKKRSIYKLPTSSITDLNNKAYIPQYVSFGPYHHGKNHLLPMIEEHKERALLHFLRRSKKSLQDLIDYLKGEVGDLKSSYAELPKEWQEGDDKFIQLMILDGCFMFEILHNFESPMKDDDPVFSNKGMHRMYSYLKHDMLMLENQLPMPVLDMLLAFESTQPKDVERLNELIQKLLFPYLKKPPTLGKCLHVLDVYRKSLLLRGEHQRGDERSQGRNRTCCKLNLAGIRFSSNDTGTGSLEDISFDCDDNSISVATELDLAGIRFRSNETGSLEDITFNRGTLKLPRIVVDGNTETIFLNLLAFERYHIETGNQEIASYIYFMDCMIESEKDVALLKSRNIVKNFLASDKDAAELFNSLAKEATLSPHSELYEVIDKVNQHCKKPWVAWGTNLNRTVEYFRKRWAFLSLVVAVCIFALTITSTVYTAIANYKNDSPTPPMIPSPPPVISRRLSSYHHL